MEVRRARAWTRHGRGPPRSQGGRYPDAGRPGPAGGDGATVTMPGRRLGTNRTVGGPRVGRGGGGRRRHLAPAGAVAGGPTGPDRGRWAPAATQAGPRSMSVGSDSPPESVGDRAPGPWANPGGLEFPDRRAVVGSIRRSSRRRKTLLPTLLSGPSLDYHWFWRPTPLRRTSLKQRDRPGPSLYVGG